MVYRLRPLQLEMDCGAGPYKLGDRIDLTVNLTPNADVDVREARVDLVCEQLYARSESSIQIGMGGSAAIQGGNPLTMTDYIPASLDVKQVTESYVHSSVVFLKDARLSSGRTSTHPVRLGIERAAPRRLDEARELERDATSSWTFKWRVVASVNVVRGRDPRRQRTVKVTLPGEGQASSDAGPRLINRPGRSHPKPPTRP